MSKNIFKDEPKIIYGEVDDIDDRWKNNRTIDKMIKRSSKLSSRNKIRKNKDADR